MRKDSLSTIIASKDEDGSSLTHEELISLAAVLMFAGKLHLH
jgi:cytochrome P450